VLPGPEQADGSQPVHRYLAHSTEDMLAANADIRFEAFGSRYLMIKGYQYSQRCKN
jgi:hypothetical protein